MDTLQKLNKTWISYLDGLEVLILPIGLVLSFVLAYFDFIELPIGAGITFVLSFTFAGLHYFAVYNLVKCPSCGSNLSKFKNGNRVPIKQLYNAFNKCSPCKHCGWTAKNGV